MKEIKLSFPYPSTSRHNLSQDVGTSLSMGLVIPVRTVEVLAGDSHRIGTSFSLISNPLIKPLLQGVNMRYCRFWVPRRIYHIDQRSNNSDFDPLEAPVRHGVFNNMYFPLQNASGNPVHLSNFGQSSLFDYLRLSAIGSNILSDNNIATIPSAATSLNTITSSSRAGLYYFNAEPYIAYLDICRNYYADSATNMICWAWYSKTASLNSSVRPCISPLVQLDAYIDGIQNGRGRVNPFDVNGGYASSTTDGIFRPFFLPAGSEFLRDVPTNVGEASFDGSFNSPHFGLCVPLNRPDRLSRLFDTKPLVSQNAVISPVEISMSNLSFLSKMQRFLTRRFFGGSRFTDVMYSVFGQKVPHVDSPVLLDVFDYEIGSELVASTNATESQNPGVLGGFFSAAGQLSTGRGGFKRRYSFNEPGYLMDLVYIMPRLFRTSFLPDYYPIASGASAAVDVPMQQANFVPDFNGIGWQQSVQTSAYMEVSWDTSNQIVGSKVKGFSCEPSWQQYRTLPDVCSGAMNPVSYTFGTEIVRGLGKLTDTATVNSPLFTFNDRMSPHNVLYGFTKADGNVDSELRSRLLLARLQFTDFNHLNSVFGVDSLTTDNIFCVFRYAHQAKRQVTKRFTLNFA